MPSDTGLLARVRALLPQGGSLPAEEWDRRHRALLTVLWLNVIVLPIYGLVEGYGPLHTFAHVGLLVALAILASDRRLSRKLRSVCTSVGLLTAAALLVHLTGGLIEAHFYFFVLIVALTLYEDWLPFLIAVAFVLFHHGVLGTIEPHEVFNHPDAWDNPWMWAGVHAFFVALAGVAGIVAWRLNEDVRRRMRDAQDELETLSETDSLTQLANRRKAMADLESLLELPAPSGVFILFDLDGFKSYNDSFGHPAGDALLIRLGARLEEAVQGRADAYRLGGDEFCVLATGSSDGRGALEALAAGALCERGQAFDVTASYGSVSLPSDANNPADAVRLADQRMYAHKQSSRTNAMHQSHDVLRQALAETDPELDGHMNKVGELVEPLSTALGMPAHEIETLRHAAELHDVGKMAIPDAILNKPGPLNDEEWTFMRRHTLIGQRIVTAAPALAPVGEIVRASHERWDGGGYPDGLAGKEIPRGARIIAVCDAYDAMTSDRSYRQGLSSEDALAELRHCAGTQFDPAVVTAFDKVRAERGSGKLAAQDAGRRVGLPGSRLAIAGVIDRS